MTTNALRMKPQLAERHQNHGMFVQYHDTTGPHRAQLRCRDCNAWLKWLSAEQAQEICRVMGDPDQ
jgi:hypothetical protein